MRRMLVLGVVVGGLLAGWYFVTHGHVVLGFLLMACGWLTASLI